MAFRVGKGECAYAALMMAKVKTSSSDPLFLSTSSLTRAFIMEDKMRHLCLAATVVLLSACASHPLAVAPRSGSVLDGKSVGWVTIAAPRNDLSKGQSMAADFKDTEDQVITGPLQNIVECDAARMSCRHAVVQTIVTINGKQTQAGQLEVSGQIRTRLGRSLTDAQKSAGFSNIVTKSLPDEIPTFPDADTTSAYVITLEPGETKSLGGEHGVKVVFQSK